MLITIISIIEWSKLITGLITALFGFALLLVVMLRWAFLLVTNEQLGKLGWTIAGCQALLSVILMITGFYIAGW